MKKVLKWIGIVLGGLLGLILVAGLVLFLLGNARLNRTYAIQVSPIALPSDAASLERGKHIATVYCRGCHGSDLGGVSGWVNVPQFGVVDSANLTSGDGGIGQEFKSVEDYIRAIRHGVDPEGKPIYMPAVVAFNQMSDEDLGALVAYLKTVPPVNHQAREHQFTPLGKVLFGAGMFSLPAEVVDHSDAHPAAPAPAVSVEYGRYLATIGQCADCHGAQLTGGHHPDPAVTAIAPNLTPGGELATWSAEQFITAMRSGVKPDGTTLNPEWMPWKEFGVADDNELKALYLYLHSLQALPAAVK